MRIIKKGYIFYEKIWRCASLIFIFAHQLYVHYFPPPLPMKKDEVRYLLAIPNSIIQEVRIMSAERKNRNEKANTQKDIFIELLELGLQQKRSEANGS